MNVDMEEYRNITPIKNCEKSATTMGTNKYILLEDEDLSRSIDSDELFSDNDADEKDLAYYSPDVLKQADTSFLDTSDTSLFHFDNNQPVTPSTAVIPSTPLSLIPFLSRINEQWTTDLETPQANKEGEKKSINSVQSSGSVEKSDSRHYTPNISKINNIRNELPSTSIKNYKRIASRTKRQIFKSEINMDVLNEFSNDDDMFADNYECKDQSLQCVNAMKYKTEEPVSRHNECTSLDFNIHKKVKGQRENSTSPNICNSPTQQFLMDISFESVDQICVSYAKKSNSAQKKSEKIHSSNIGFSTASGKQVTISERAIAKAKALFDKEDINVISETMCTRENTKESKAIIASSRTLLEADNSTSVNKENICTVLNSKKSFKSVYPHREEEKAAVSFTTAKGQPIKTSEKAISKARQLFTNEMDEPICENVETSKSVSVNENKPNAYDISFMTASRKSLYISEKALSKAKTLFADDYSGTDAAKYQENENDLSLLFSNGNTFQQNVSEKLLSRTKTVLKDQSNISPRDCKENHISNFRTEKQSAASPYVATGDQSFKVSNKTTYQTNKTSVYQSNNVKVNNGPEIISTSLETRSIQHNTVSNFGFCTAAGQKLNVSKEALLKAEALFADAETDPVQYKESINKRKSFNLHEDTLDRTLLSQTKKARFSDNDFIRTNYASSIKLEKKKMDTTNISCAKTTNTVSLSNEIMESTAALLADETEHDENLQWISQIEKCKSKDEVKNNKTSTNINSNYNNSAGSQQVERQSYPVNKSVSSFVVEKESEFDISSVDLDDLNFLDEVTTILQKRLTAASEQEEVINAKKINRPKPIIGKLLLHKQLNCSSHLSWRSIVGSNVPKLCTYQELMEQNIPAEIFYITSATASSFKFRCSDFYGEKYIQTNTHGLEMEDGGLLIPDEKGYAGISEIKRCFLASPGVDPALVPAGWIENHYRWIVWKLASMDRVKFGSIKLPRALIPSRVVAQLKYRYDREIDRSQRPPLRRILEKDDCASRRMILCVSSITKPKAMESIENSSKILSLLPWKMMLTDGWYSVAASIDSAMTDYIATGKVSEGTKLITFGAELLNLDQGCSPLEIPPGACLKIHTNSTRRVRWDAKLGYSRQTGPMLIKLRSVSPNGGLIGRIKVTVSRVYPILYHEKDSSGKSVFRNSRCEEKANLVYERECRSKIEEFYTEVEKRLSSGKKDAFDSDSINFLTAQWNENCDKVSTEEYRSKHKQEKILNECRLTEEQFKQKLELKLQERLPPPRQISSVLKVRVFDDCVSAILTVWSPREEVLDTLKEGACVSISNVFASGKRIGDLQLTACKNTQFKKESVCKNPQYSRTFTPLSKIIDSSFNPLYSEFDTVGIVSCITNSPYGMKNFEAVTLAYTNDDHSDSFYLSILFWQGISAYGYAEILTVGSIVACSNLEWRHATSWSIPVCYCTERSTFTRNPRQNHFYKALENLKSVVKNPFVYATNCAEEIAIEMQRKSGIRTTTYDTPEKQMLSKLNSSNAPRHSLGSNSADAKSTSIHNRLVKLQRYSDPPELSKLVLRNSSKRISLNFRSPVRRDNINSSKIESSE